MKSLTQTLRLWWMALIVLALFTQGIQIWKCSTSPLAHFPDVFRNSDMFATKAWARSILEQGWTNPEPFHPETTWMKRIGTQAEWEAWWGGREIFQQSPLYAYLVAAFLTFGNDLIYLHAVQGLCAVLLFALIGWITAHITRNQWAGLVGFGIAAAYAPYYAYSWEIVRDLLSWVITALLIVLLCKLKSVVKTSNHAPALALAIGFCLGAGYLTREVYAVLIPLVWAVTFWVFHRHRKRPAWMAVVLGTLVALAPLMVRNMAVGAPLLSSSNRFAEAFIQGNAASSHAYFFVIPRDTRAILDKTAGKPWPLVKATLQTHPSISSWFAHQGSKFLSLMDPFESPDNVSFPFVEQISPFVKWGIRHWMIITPGLIGLLISLIRMDIRHWPLWIVLPALIGAIAVAIPLSRYRQAFAVLWIPWTVYFGFCLIQHLRRRDWPRAVGLTLCLVAGWTLSLGPLSRCPPQFRDRPSEYAVSVDVYRKLGRADEAEQMLKVLREKFPAFPIPRAQE
jgi:4-amino-4-deoxy-L-arabinose transferase-like glycosyltransferase